MTDFIDDGWLELSDVGDSMKLMCERITWKRVISNENKHMDGDINFTIPFGQKYILVIAQGIFLDTHQKYSDFSENISIWQRNGGFTMKISRDGSNYIEIDGINTSYPVALADGFDKAEKISNGNQQIYYISKMILEQSGAPS